jgi:hypothetical protein
MPQGGYHCAGLGREPLVESLGSLKIHATELVSIGRFKASALILLHRDEDFRLLAPASLG